MAEALRAYLVAHDDPTRAAILGELEHAGELTPTQLAKRLGLTANNVYHHIRVLRGMGVLAEPRAVPGPTYVEKYYRVRPDISRAIADPDWPDYTQQAMSVEQRQAFICGHLLSMAAYLRRAAKRYAAMDPAEFDRLREQWLILSSINEATRERLVAREHAWRETLAEERARYPSDEPQAGQKTDLLLMAGLPNFWDDE